MIFFFVNWTNLQNILLFIKCFVFTTTKNPMYLLYFTDEGTVNSDLAANIINETEVAFFPSQAIKLLYLPVKKNK